MNIQTNFSLKNYNTFGIDAKAKQFVSVSSISELKEVLTANNDIFILGGGSNMLLTQDILKTPLQYTEPYRVCRRLFYLS